MVKKETGKVYYTKTGRPYIIKKDGRAQFITMKKAGKTKAPAKKGKCMTKRR